MPHDVSTAVLVTVAAMVAIGIGAVVAVVRRTRSDQRRLREGPVADGRVVALVPVESFDDRTTTYRTQFEFRDQAGAMHNVTTRSAERPAPFKVGAVVRVYYDPANPEGATIVRWTWHIISGILAVLVIVGAALVYWAAANGKL